MIMIVDVFDKFGILDIYGYTGKVLAESWMCVRTFLRDDGSPRGHFNQSQ